MANIASAAKRARQAERSNLRNRALKSKVKSIRKQVLEAVAAGDKKAATTSLDAFSSAIDKASKTNLIHRNAASRSKGKLARQIAALS
jgi:small subunit ribosomal protein S20